MDEHAPQIAINGEALTPRLSGAVWWPARRTLIVADLHLEKGSGFAQRGQHLPPYDTGATLAALEAELDRLQPAAVICLGDSFHDRQAQARMASADRQRLAALVARQDWVWIAGNHDPLMLDAPGGTHAREMTVGALTFRHEAVGAAAGELSGHFHPKAAVRARTGRITARCFAEDGRRMILPAFGAYTGGMNVMAPSVRQHFARRFHAHLIGRGRLFRLPSTHLLRDGGAGAGARTSAA